METTINLNKSDIKKAEIMINAILKNNHQTVQQLSEITYIPVHEVKRILKEVSLYIKRKEAGITEFLL